MAKNTKNNLGRGLDALFAEVQEIEQEVGALQNQNPDGQNASAFPRNTLPIGLIEANPDQPRRQFNPEALAELVASIQEKGVLSPILVRPIGPERYQIVAGERRWRAAAQANLDEVPVIIRDIDEKEAMQLALIENVQRRDLNPIEEAHAYQQLIKTHGLRHELLAKYLGKSRSHITNMLRLLNLPKSVQQFVVNGQLSNGHARALLSSPHPETMAEKAIRDGLSVRQTEEMVSQWNYKFQKSKHSPPQDSQDITSDAAGGETEFSANMQKTTHKTIKGRETGQNQGANQEEYHHDSPIAGDAQGAKSVRMLDSEDEMEARALEKSLSDMTGMKVALQRKTPHIGQISFGFTDFDQLDQFLSKLGKAYYEL